MNILIVFIVLVSIYSLLCYLGMGSDFKNVKSLKSYPSVIQDRIKELDKYKDYISNSNVIVSFISNLLVFSIILFICGLFIREDKFIVNFINILIIGEGLNLYDLLILDILWFRNSKRVRFSEIEDKFLYRDPSNHIKSFLRAIVMFMLASLIAAILLEVIR